MVVCLTSRQLLRSSCIRLEVRRSMAIGFVPVEGSVDASRHDYKTRLCINQLRAKQLCDLQASTKAGGSEASIKRHTEQHRKLLVRDRVARVIDKGTDFHELGTLVGHAESLPGAGAGVVCGVGQVHARHCMFIGHDATVKGGAVYPMGVRKQLRAQRLSRALRLPCVYLMDTGGAFLPLQADIFPDRNHGGRVFANEALLGAMGLPQLSIVLGSCTAGGAYGPTMTDNAIIVDKIGHIFLGGPPLVRAALGEVVSAEDLGGAKLHTGTSGAADYFAEDEEQALGLCRDLMQTVAYAQRQAPNMMDKATTIIQQPKYSIDELAGLAGSELEYRPFALQVLARLADGSEMCEFREMYGVGLITGYIRIHGVLVGVVCASGEPVQTRAAEKACQFVQMCEQSGTPLLFMQRSLHHGWEQYSNADLKAHGQLLSALSTSTVPRLVLNMGGCYGADYYLMSGQSFEPTLHFAWPDAHVAEYRDTNEHDGAFPAAHENYIDDIILPENTRDTLGYWLHALPAMNVNQRNTAQRFMRM